MPVIGCCSNQSNHHCGDVDGGAQLEGGDEKQTNKKSEMHFNPKDLQQSCRGEQL